MFETARATAKESTAYTSQSPPLNCWLELSSDDENYDNTDTDAVDERSEQWLGLNHNSSAFIRRRPVQSSTSMERSNKGKNPIWKLEFKQPASNYAQFRDTLG